MSYPQRRDRARDEKFAGTASSSRSKPVRWSGSNRPRSPSRVEYEDDTSDTVWVKFPCRSTSEESGNREKLLGASVLMDDTLDNSRQSGSGYSPKINTAYEVTLRRWQWAKLEIDTYCRQLRRSDRLRRRKLRA